MPRLGAHVRDQRTLLVVVRVAGDCELLADPRGGAVGSHYQRRRQLRAAAQGECDPRLVIAQFGQSIRAVAPHRRFTAERLPQAIHQQRVFHDPAKTVAAQFIGDECQLTAGSGIPHPHLAICLCARGQHLGPHAKRLQQGGVVRRECKHAQVCHIRLPRRRLMRFDQRHPAAIAGQRQCSAGADHTGADHDHIEHLGAAHAGRANAGTQPR